MATDLDTINGRNWIWHYIKNLHADHGLGYKWPKAGLRRALGSPLEVGKTDCNRYFVTTQPALDDNAPITYGTNDAVQRAGVYSESKNAPPAGPSTGTGPGTPAEPAGAPATPTTGSIIETSYKTGAGLAENVRVSVSTRQGTNVPGWLLQIERTPNVIVAMATAFLNGSQVKSLVEQFRSQSIVVDADYLLKAIGRDERDNLSAG